MKNLLLIGLLCLLPAALDAQRIEGKDAPDFSMGGLVNRDGPVDKADMAGDVIVIKVWGIT
ncbi:MAG: hypothetical protein H6840_01920 [Planctomycetes bacterium]|nr:hypothetical protein [Planctomycetota bacterium]